MPPRSIIIYHPPSTEWKLRELCRVYLYSVQTTIFGIVYQSRSSRIFEIDSRLAFSRACTDPYLNACVHSDGNLVFRRHYTRSISRYGYRLYSRHESRFPTLARDWLLRGFAGEDGVWHVDHDDSLRINLSPHLRSPRFRY